MTIDWPLPAFEEEEKDKNVFGRLPAKFYQTNRQVRNWGRRSGAKSLEVAMCCRRGEGKKVNNPRAILPTCGKARRD